MGIQLTPAATARQLRSWVELAGPCDRRIRRRPPVSLVGLVLVLLLPMAFSAAAQAALLPHRVHPAEISRPDSLVAVIDRSTPFSSGLEAAELFQLVATARYTASSRLRAQGFVVLPGETTDTVLGAAGRDTTECEGECETAMGRRLTVDWLLSLRVSQFESRWMLHATVTRISDGTRLGDRTAACDSRRELLPSLQKLVSDLCAIPLPAQSASHPIATTVDTPPLTAIEIRRALNLSRRDAPATSRSLRTQDHIRKHFSLQVGYGSDFFFPRNYAASGPRAVRWGGGLRLTDPSQPNYDLLLDWWSTDGDQVGYSLLRIVAEITSMHLGPFHPYGRAGVQVIKTHTKQDERMLLGGAGVQYRLHDFLALSGGMDLMANRGSKIRIGSVNRCWRSELALSGANHTLDVVGLFGGDVKENASISARLRLFPASGALP